MLLKRYDNNFDDKLMTTVSSKEIKGRWLKECGTSFTLKNNFFFILLFLFLAITLAKSMDIKYNSEQCQEV